MLKVQQSDGIKTLTLSRPERGNALGPALVEALIVEVTSACDDMSLHTLRLRADGKHFCTGFDLSDLAECSDGDLLHRFVRVEHLLALLWHAPMRTAVWAQGRTWGAGADLFAVCEQRVAAPDTTWRFPGAQFGIVLGSRRLAERIGSDAARYWVIGGGQLNVQQALAAGLATAVGAVEDDGIGPVSVATARAVRRATRADHRDADLAALVRSAAEPGLRERIEAYRERLRKPE